MSHSHSNALRLSRRVLRLLIAINLVIGFGILALLVASIVAPTTVFGALGIPPTGSAPLGARAVMAIGLVATPITHLFLTRLRAIVATVEDGDPFVPENATRLTEIAWAVLGLEVLHVGVGIVRAGAALEIDWSFSLTPWLAVLLLFVLARVFDEGTRMRDDLEGTV